jgi:hypothetical protein
MTVWHVTTTAGAFCLHALTATAAITTALELAGAKAKVITVIREGEW